MSLSRLATNRFRFNPFDPSFQQNPYPVYTRLRSEFPYFRNAGILILTRYADVKSALKERRLSVELIPDTVVRMAAKLDVIEIEQVIKFIRNSIVFTDDPEHLRLRRLVNQAYSPLMLSGLRSLIQTEIDRLLDEAEGMERLDAIAELAAPLPLAVFCSWMGIPRDLHKDIGRHVRTIRHLLDPGLMSKKQYADVITSVAELTKFFVNHAREVMSRGEDNLVTCLSTVSIEDDRLSETEVAFACIMSFVAGNETTQCMIGNTLHLLHRFPDQLLILRDDPLLVSKAIEESIRFETPLQMTKRRSPVELEINGTPIHPDEQILLCLGAANRDPDAFDNPEVFNILRTGNHHVGFGHGMHACLGAALARMQTEMCLRTILDRFQSIEFLESESRWQSHSLILRGLEKLPVRLSKWPAKRLGRR